jgi:hypothetical protein
MAKTSDKNSKLNLQPGEFVEVKAESEIMDTLDERSTLEGLLFAQEMRKYCGKKFRVLKRVNKLILEGLGTLRRIENVVILDGAVCSGEYHGGCKKSCLLLWKEAWLKKVDP